MRKVLCQKNKAVFISNSLSFYFVLLFFNMELQFHVFDVLQLSNYYFTYEHYYHIALSRFLEVAVRRYSQKGVLKHFTKFKGKHLCQSCQSASVCNFIKKETLTQVLSYEFCEIFKNTFFYRIPPVAASGFLVFILLRACYQEIKIKKLLQKHFEIQKPVI